MQLSRRPYFMTNRDWYTVDENFDIVLTDKATPKAIDSYLAYKEAIEKELFLAPEDRSKDDNDITIIG